MLVRIRYPERLVYPKADGRPVGESKLQIHWITTLLNGLEALFRDRPDVFVAADLFWYPRYGDPTTVTAPDVLVAFGRPKGERPSYKQWEEGGVAPQVVFEVLSPSNTPAEMRKKRAFYRRFGVEEYYEYDPHEETFEVWTRDGRRFPRLADPDGFVSPRLGVRFDYPPDGPLRLVGPDGRPFATYLELAERADAERRRADALAARLRELGVDPDAG